jgi:hypothetical protein
MGACRLPEPGLTYVAALRKAERPRNELLNIRARTTFAEVLCITDEVPIELDRGDLVAA